MGTVKDGTVVVTGAGNGIGRAIADRLAADGFRVALWDFNQTDAETAADGIREGGGQALAVACDVTARDQVDSAAEMTTTELGSVYALVNNAGTDRMSLFKDSDPKDWQHIINVNLFGVFNVTQAVVPAMIQAEGGRIVSISSDAARVGSTGEAVYAASKAGVLGFTKALAREVARHGICVNAICPGPTDTALLDTVRQRPKGDKIVAGMIRAVPMGRVAEPVDIAGAVAFFLSDDAGYITGQTLSVSGGLTMA